MEIVVTIGCIIICLLAWVSFNIKRDEQTYNQNKIIKNSIDRTRQRQQEIEDLKIEFFILDQAKQRALDYLLHKEKYNNINSNLIPVFIGIDLYKPYIVYDTNIAKYLNINVSYEISKKFNELIKSHNNEQHNRQTIP